MKNDNSLTLAVALKRLVGCPLISVTFVMDYMQMIFDRGTITITSVPFLVKRGETIDWDAAGFSEVLRKQIGVSLKAVSVNEKEVTLSFDNEIRLMVPLEGSLNGEHFVFNDESGVAWIG